MSDIVNDWRPAMVALADDLRRVTREAIEGARRDGEPERLGRPAGRGVGDVTFELDVPSETLLTDWLEEHAREAPLSLLTEDAGWRHRGPDGSGGVRSLDGFDHGGPRISVDPVDGTRNLFADLRSAWSVVALAGPGPGAPRLSDVELGVVGEIPGARASAFRRLVGERGGGCTIEEVLVEGASAGAGARALVVDSDDRCDHGYFPFFRYSPRQRPDLARLEAAFFARLAEHEEADVDRCYDDQYISNAGQLFLLSLGTYRAIFDVRAAIGDRRSRKLTSKPYDLAGVVVCARAAGCVVTDPSGDELDFELNAETPIAFVGYANAATQRRLEPHWLAAFRGSGVRGSE